MKYTSPNVFTWLLVIKCWVPEPLYQLNDMHTDTSDHPALHAQWFSLYKISTKNSRSLVYKYNSSEILILSFKCNQPI